jgi:ABC-type glycerol-3-phosphate transport system permease component
MFGQRKGRRRLSAPAEQFTTQWGNIMAAGVLTTLPVLVFFFLLQRALTRGLVSGATRG